MNPFVGLRSFERDDSILFFGRSQQTMELLGRLHLHHFVAVVGSSGSGKSSLLRAGLIPQLVAGYLVEDSDQWSIVILKPGQSPLFNLIEALLLQIDPTAKAEKIAELVKRIHEEGADVIIKLIAPLWQNHNINIFFLVDQFEELFRFAMEQNDISKKDEAIDFVNILLELSQQQVIPLFIVITMRSDFIGDCTQFQGLPEVMNQSQYLVPRISRSQLKSVVEGPAKLFGGSVNPSLTSHLLNELAKVKDELPLLQHALMRMWDRNLSDNIEKQLKLEDYEAIGGIEMALSNHADEAFFEMDIDRFSVTKKIFQALTTIDENGRKIRRPVKLSEVVKLTGRDKEQILEIINLFVLNGRSFLIVNKIDNGDDTLIDITHESLIRQWKMLSNWVDEEAESAANYLRLAEASRQYEQGRKDLLSGTELALNIEWYQDVKPTAFWAYRYEKGFEKIIKYLNESDKKQKIEKEKRGIEKRKKKTRLYMLLTALAVTAFTALWVCLHIYQLNEKNSKVYKAFSLYFDAQKIAETDPTLALRLEEVVYAPLPLDSLLIRKTKEKLFLSNNFYRILRKEHGQIKSVEFSSDGQSILSTCSDHNAYIAGCKNRLLDTSYKSASVPILLAKFLQGGRRIITTTNRTNTVYVWGKKNDTQPLSCQKINVLAVSDSDKIFVSDGKTCELYDLISDKSIIDTAFFSYKGLSVTAAAFSADGSQLLLGSLGKIGIFNIKTLRYNTLISKMPTRSSHPISLSLSRDNKTILTIFSNKTLMIYHLATNSALLLPGQNFNSAVFSKDGQQILVGRTDNKAQLLDLSGNLLQEFKGHNGSVNGVAFSPDNTMIATGGSDSTIRIWYKKDITRLIDAHKGEVYILPSTHGKPDTLTLEEWEKSHYKFVLALEMIEPLSNAQKSKYKTKQFEIEP